GILGELLLDLLLDRLDDLLHEGVVEARQDAERLRERRPQRLLRTRAILQLAHDLVHVALALGDRSVAKQAGDARRNLRADDLLALAVGGEVLLEDRNRLAIRVGDQAERDDRRDAEILLRGAIRALALEEREQVVLDLRADLGVGRARADE